MHGFDFGKAMKDGHHRKKVESEKQATYQVYQADRPLSDQDVRALERLIVVKNFADPVPFVCDYYMKNGDQMLWSALVAAESEKFSPVDASAFCLNSLLCHGTEQSMGRIKYHIFFALEREEEFFVLGMKNLAYYHREYGADLFRNANMLRAGDTLVSAKVLKILADLKLTEAVITSAIRFEDLAAVNYALAQVVPANERNSLVRKCLRVAGSSKAFRDLALEGYSSVASFADDLIAAVKSGSRQELLSVYNQAMVSRCYDELIKQVMRESYSKKGAIANAQLLIRMVIESGLDTYNAFVYQYCGAYGAIDQLSRPRLTSQQILDRIHLKQAIDSASSLDPFLHAISFEDILAHPKHESLCDRLHKMTGEEKYLKFTSRRYRGDLVSSQLGV
jgi:hypothetical protein